MTVSTTASLSTSSAQPPLRPRSQQPTGDCLPCHARGQTHHHYHEVVARHWGMCRTRTSRTMQLLAKHWHRNMAGVEAVLPLQGGEPGRLQACPQLQPLPNPTRYNLLLATVCIRSIQCTKKYTCQDRERAHLCPATGMDAPLLSVMVWLSHYSVPPQ
uniref:Uncharacterized protein n=1 Tax=Aegilops tauschii subsp. strangulata TaxID=200361 RepID=A0A453I2Z1_AEGTS